MTNVVTNRDVFARQNGGIARFRSSVVTFLAGTVTLLLITGCMSTKGTFCQIAKPHRFSDATVNAMTDAEVQQELTFNKQGAKLCGWKP